MHQSHTVKPKNPIDAENAKRVKTLIDELMDAVGNVSPNYGTVAVTFLAGKPTQVEKRESFRP